MKYNVGDKVRFLNEVGGGTISGIINSSTVNVVDEDGFEVPVRAADLVVVGHSEQIETAKQAEVERTESSVEESYTDIVDSDDYELLLAFVPEDRSNPADCSLDLYFINDSSFYCTYIVSKSTGTDSLILLEQSTVEPETKEYVCSIDRAVLNSKLNLNITSFLYKHKEYRYYPPEQINVDLNPVKLAKNSSFVENDFFDENAYILKIAANVIPELKISINPQELEKAIKQKEPAKPAEPVQKIKPDVEEIDLHIEELVEDVKSLDSGQIFEIQKARFIIALESGLTSKTRKMVFIHGVGNGKLKHEIRRLLDTQYAGLVYYHDASFKEYGFGATMVILA
jgi:putative NIF3 family GTP cyclohydrolase 1 type 2